MRGSEKGSLRGLREVMMISDHSSLVVFLARYSAIALPVIPLAPADAFTQAQCTRKRDKPVMNADFGDIVANLASIDRLESYGSGVE